jgi:serine/threonine protein phosphatase PrpC
VGDSRTYIYRQGAGLAQITRDHSLVARLVAAGAIAAEDVYTHPDRNKIYRGLGEKDSVQVDWFIEPLRPGDYVLLCSDGLWEMVRDYEIEKILKRCLPDVAQVSDALVKAALHRGGSDNVSVIVAPV